ncbi:hypothetical protein Hanom_Chr07g00611231 [Helianthus anomalus]
MSRMVRLWIGFSVRVTRVRLNRFSSLGPVLRVFIRRISPQVDSVNSTKSTRSTAESQFSIRVGGSGRQFGSEQPVQVGLGSGLDQHESTRLTRSTWSTQSTQRADSVSSVFRHEKMEYCRMHASKPRLGNDIIEVVIS